MLSGIIFYNNDEYQIYTSDNKYCLKHLISGQTLSEDEAQILFKEIFDGDMTFYKNENDYIIYKDAAGNKRYFKNGIEDFNLFFFNNGESALLKEQDDNQKIVKEEPKRFSFKTKVGVVILICTMGTMSLVSTVSNILKWDPDDGYNRYKHPFIYEHIIDQYVSPEMPTTEEVIAAILTSNDKELTQDAKNYLANEEFIEFVLTNSDDIRATSLRKKIDNINIEYFSEQYKEENPNCYGYYDLLNPNTLYLRNSVDDVSKDSSISHEFVHLMQHDNAYIYIREACAELMSYEFYGKDIIAYQELIKRTCILMEIIGPEPILDCNFKGNIESFEKAIYDILGEEKGADFLYYLCRTPGKEDKQQINAAIDKYLEEMYEIVYNEKIDNNPVISDIKEMDIKEFLTNRHYFKNNNLSYGDYPSIQEAFTEDTLKTI